MIDIFHDSVDDSVNLPAEFIDKALAESFSRVVEDYPRLMKAVAKAEFSCSGFTSSIVGDKTRHWSELTVPVAPVISQGSLSAVLDSAMMVLCEKIDLSLMHFYDPFIRSMQKGIVGFQPEDRVTTSEEWLIDCYFAVHEMAVPAMATAE